MSVIFMHSGKSSKVSKKPKIFSCYVCSNTFTQMSNLRKHLRNIHRIQMNLRRKGTDYECLICSLTFSRKTSLARHQVKAHKLDEDKLEYIERYLCNACTAVFDDCDSLRTHRRNRHGEDDVKIDNPYECGECGELFHKKRDLKNHMRYRHLSETDNYHFLRNILPSVTSSVNVIWYSVLNEAQQHFKAKFTMLVKSKAEIEKWINEFQYKNKITLRKRSVHRVVKSNVIYQVKYGCHHNTKPKRSTAHVSPKHTKCEASLAMKLFKLSRAERNYAEVRIIHTHNHVLDSLDVLKFREPTKEIKKKFGDMFLTGMTPAQALLQHKKDLEQQYGDEYFKIIGDRGICPNKSWVYNYRGICFKRKDRQLDEEISEDEAVTISSAVTETIKEEASSTSNKTFPLRDADRFGTSSNGDREIVTDLPDIDFSMLNSNVRASVKNIVHIPYPVDISDVPMNSSKVVFSTTPTLRKVHDFPTVRYEADMLSDPSVTSKIIPLKSLHRKKDVEDVLDADNSLQPETNLYRGCESIEFYEPTIVKVDVSDLKEDLTIENVIYSNDDSFDSCEQSQEETVIVNAPFSEDSFSEMDRSNVQTIIEEFDRMNEMIKEKARENGFLVDGMQQMIYNFHQNLQDLNALSNAMYSFGGE